MRTRERPKVLCLGVSYPDIQRQLITEGYRPDVLKETKPGIDQVVEAVMRNVLTEMDGRDLARCIAMERKHNVEAYTVSQELGAAYSTKHLHANFNRSSFCRALQDAFGKEVRFRQIILDYFWIPKGTWSMTHWTKAFFEVTLPNLAQFLEQPREHSQKLECGVIFLPFCYHCVKQIVAHLKTLNQYYTISFVPLKQLEGNGLFSGTQAISATTMQETFGKRIDQEEVYCTFGPPDVFQEMDDSTVTKGDIVKFLRCIEDFEDIRMIRLKPLPIKQRGKGHFGGFVNLHDPSDVERGFDQMAGSNVRRVTDDSNSESTEEESEEEESEEESEEEVLVREKKPRKQTKRTSETKRRGRKCNEHAKKRRLVKMVENMEAYELIDEYPDLFDLYVIEETASAIQFPDFRRSYWEILNNEYRAKPHCSATIDCLATGYDNCAAEIVDDSSIETNEDGATIVCLPTEYDDCVVEPVKSSFESNGDATIAGHLADLYDSCVASPVETPVETNGDATIESLAGVTIDRITDAGKERLKTDLNSSWGDCVHFAAEYGGIVAESAGPSVDTNRDAAPSRSCQLVQESAAPVEVKRFPPRFDNRDRGDGDALEFDEAAVKLLLSNRGIVVYPWVEAQTTSKGEGTEGFKIVQRLVRQEVKRSKARAKRKREYCYVRYPPMF